MDPHLAGRVVINQWTGAKIYFQTIYGYFPSQTYLVDGLNLGWSNDVAIQTVESLLLMVIPIVDMYLLYSYIPMIGILLSTYIQMHIYIYTYDHMYVVTILILHFL